MSESALVQTWLINDRINRFFIESLSAEQWNSKLTKGRAVNAHFCHIHNVRLMWIKSIDASLLTDLPKLEGDESPQEVAQALQLSAKVIAGIIEDAVASGKRVKGAKPHTEAFVGYLISHESHHRGEAEWILRQGPHPLDDKISFGLWEWGSRINELSI